MEIAMNVPAVFLWGFVATVFLTTIMSAGQGLGLSRMSIPYLLGTLFTPDHRRAVVIGFVLHFFNGWLFAVIYALIFESLCQSGWMLGVFIALVQALFLLIALMPIMPNFHPRMASEYRGPEPTRALEPPGFLALNYGRCTPLLTIAAHLIYGAIIGAFYQPLCQ
ncbi:MAG: hypothetical protein R6X15_04790 [Pseudomonadota bacterium]